MGRTKVFLQSPKTVFDLEDRRRNRMQYLATLIQKVYRGHVERQKVGREGEGKRKEGEGRDVGWAAVTTTCECVMCVRECHKCVLFTPTDSSSVCEGLRLQCQSAGGDLCVAELICD